MKVKIANFCKVAAGAVLFSVLFTGCFGLFGRFGFEADYNMVKITGSGDVADFEIGETELTYKKWYEVYRWAINNGYKFDNKGVEGGNSAIGKRPDRDSDFPVTGICWRDAIVWCNAYSRYEGLTPVYIDNRGNELKDSNEYIEFNISFKDKANGYRLPSEEEWELALGTGPGSGAGDLEKYAWYINTSSGRVHEVGCKSKNQNGLYDMQGNVAELCFEKNPDRKSEECRLLKGGHYVSQADECSIFRGSAMPDECQSYIGFRPVRSVK